MSQAERPTALATALATTLAVAILAWSAPGHAQLEFVPLAMTQLERSSYESTALENNYRSNLLRATVGFEADYLFSRQQLFLDASYGKVSYDSLGEFGDDEYNFRGGMEWLIGRYLDGTLEAVLDKQVPSISSVVEGNSIEEERRLTALTNAQLAQRWRLETAAISRSLDTPILEISNFGLRETIKRVGLRYLTTSRLSFGAEYEDIDGNFRNAPELAEYTQRTPSAFLEYAVTDLHTVRLKLGRTERDQTDEPKPYKETTGYASIERILTGKTAVNLQVSREIENYFGAEAGAFALVDTWIAGVNWKATGTSTLYVSYGETRTEFLGNSVAGLATTGRVDDDSSINVSLKNKTLPWLTSELYLEINDVHSNIEIFSYDSVVFGLKFEARLNETSR